MLCREHTLYAALLVSSLFLFAEAARGDESLPKAGSFNFTPVHEELVPDLFRLKAASDLSYATQPVETVSEVFRISAVTFASPVVTPHAANNTVHCEYFCPITTAKHPGVIVLHILGGDFELSRLFCRALATRGCAALFLKMPYYGPRREHGVKARMISTDPRETVKGMIQAVKDVRYGAAWLANRPEVDPAQLGVMGISLGGITGALAFTAEPRLNRACLILAGGDIGRVMWGSEHLHEYREAWEKQGGTQESFFALVRTVDPATYGANVRGRKVLMLNARQDEVVPPVCSESLWKAFGKPKILWWDAGHYTAARYIFDGLDKTTRFFAPEDAVD